MLSDFLGTRFGVDFPSNNIHKLALRIHEIKENRMVNQVVLAGLDVWWSRKVHTILFAHVLHGFVSARQTNNRGMEILQVLSYNFGRVTSRVASDEDGLQLDVIVVFEFLQHLAQLI